MRHESHAKTNNKCSEELQWKHVMLNFFSTFTTTIYFEGLIFDCRIRLHVVGARTPPFTEAWFSHGQLYAPKD